ncbi:MAG: hypothetical protein WBQ55_09350 [Xanthobacteraceae bacterium]|jgi:hypothetical protein
MFPCRRDGRTTSAGHPVANALRIKAQEIGANIPYCEETKYRIGLGVEGQVNGYYMHVGNERFLRQANIKATAPRPTVRRSTSRAIPASTSRSTVCSQVSCPIPTGSGRKAVTSSGACMKPASAIP